MGVLMFAFYMTLTSIGQEGGAFLNLQIIPFKEREVVKAKLATALIPSVCAMTAVTAIIQIIVPLRLEALIAVAVTLFAVLFECAFVGLAAGTLFPDFAEVPRARFIDQKGVWLGMLLLAGCLGATFLPLALYGFSILTFPLLITPVLSAVTGIIICYASYRGILNQLQKLTQT
jgi:hypothetical protein